MQNYTVFLNSRPDGTIVGGTEAGQPAADAATGTETGTPATAGQTADAGILGSPIIWIIYIPLIIGLYFLMTRGQRKRDKQMKEMQSGMKAGDNIITAGGFFGKIADVGEDCFIVEFGVNRGIRIPVQKSDCIAIRSPKMTPAPAPKEIESKEKEK